MAISSEAKGTHTIYTPCHYTPQPNWAANPPATFSKTADTLGHYQVSQIGWEGKRRADDVFLHIDLIEGEVWLQHDGTNLRIAEYLVRAGIPKENIVLAFHHPNRRPDTEYATA